MPRKRRILICDDETDFCDIMRMFFMRKGYEVYITHTIREGMALLKEIQPDFLILDNNLPDGNGWDSLNEIVEIIPHIRVYLVSAHRDKTSFTGKHENIAVWEKPISMQILESVF